MSEVSDVNGAKLYVGSLPYETTDDQLREIFTPYGTVTSAKVITDRLTNKSRGFGFVEMSTAEEAQKAIDGLNGSRYENRTLVVNEARPKEGRGGGRGGNDRGGRW
jgi:RNA recognition motif-containing protein